MTETIGKREDDKAFEEMLERANVTIGQLFIEAKQEQGPASVLVSHLRLLPLLIVILERVLRFTFDAGMERGQEKRGCCDEREGHD